MFGQKLFTKSDVAIVRSRDAKKISDLLCENKSLSSQAEQELITQGETKHILLLIKNCLISAKGVQAIMKRGITEEILQVLTVKKPMLDTKIAKMILQRDNEDEILSMIVNAHYSEEVVSSVIQRGKHIEIMRLIANVDVSEANAIKIIERDNEEEIRKVVERCRNLSAESLLKILQGEKHHTAVMAFLQKKWRISSVVVDAVFQRGNHEEIMQMLNNRCCEIPFSRILKSENIAEIETYVEKHVGQIGVVDGDEYLKDCNNVTLVKVFAGKGLIRSAVLAAWLEKGKLDLLTEYAKQIPDGINLLVQLEILKKLNA